MELQNIHQNAWAIATCLVGFAAGNLVWLTHKLLRKRKFALRGQIRYGYWAIRGLAQPTRLMFEYTGVAYEEERYQIGSAPSFDRSVWYDKKHHLDLQFPNLPYLIHGEIRITQSDAINRYIARQFDLMGSTEDDEVQVDMLLNEAYDMRSKMVYTSYTRKDLYDQKKAELDSLYLPKELELFAKYLGDKHWFVGRGKGVLTLVDFVLYELLDQLIVMSPQCVKPFPVFMAYLQRFRNLDPIKRYMSSQKFIERPINNLSASFY